MWVFGTCAAEIFWTRGTERRASGSVAAFASESANSIGAKARVEVGEKCGGKAEDVHDCRVPVGSTAREKHLLVLRAF